MEFRDADLDPVGDKILEKNVWKKRSVDFLFASLGGSDILVRTRILLFFVIDLQDAIEKLFF
jgi:hypothetical protein